MKENNKYCFNCRRYEELYTKKFCNFEKQKYGLCSKTKQVMEMRSNCDKYEYKTRNNKLITKNIRISVISRQLDGIIKNLTEAGQILKEEILREEKEDK